jgi:hypothetical protein
MKRDFKIREIRDGIQPELEENKRIKPLARTKGQRSSWEMFS